jgi:hypothetical protein
MKAPQLADALRQLQIPSITDGTYTWKANTYSMLKRGKNGAPTGKLMRKVLKEWIDSHPGTNTTVVEQQMSAGKHELLYTPPYESWLQPIELIWARVKHTVAMQSSRDRKYQQTAEQTKTALSEVPASLCQRVIEHTEKLMSKWLSSPAAGSLSVWPTLGQLVAAKHEVIGKGADLAVENADLIQGRVKRKKSRQRMKLMHRVTPIQMRNARRVGQKTQVTEDR